MWYISTLHILKTSDLTCKLLMYYFNHATYTLKKSKNKCYNTNHVEKTAKRNNAQ